jgi:hypothetical protein
MVSVREAMMPNKKISRNDPCPCGSGKKFKHCCLGKDIDWQVRQAPAARKPLPAVSPRHSAPPDFASLGLYRVVDTRLKEIAAASPSPASWKELVGRLADTTPNEERMQTYRTIREAGVLPADAAWFIIGHAIQWMPPAVPVAPDAPDDVDEVEGDEVLDRHTLDLLRRYGADDMAELYVTNRLEYDRRHERGRQFFFGPPDEMLAQRLREKGIIE